MKTHKSARQVVDSGAENGYLYNVFEGVRHGIRQRNQCVFNSVSKIAKEIVVNVMKLLVIKWCTRLIKVKVAKRKHRLTKDIKLYHVKEN